MWRGGAAGEPHHVARVHHLARAGAGSLSSGRVVAAGVLVAAGVVVAASVAQCILVHRLSSCSPCPPSGAANNPDGENLYMRWGEATDEDLCIAANAAFYGEAASYNFKQPAFEGIDGGQVGHFTQLVWAGSTQVGCAVRSGCPPDPEMGITGAWDLVVW